MKKYRAVATDRTKDDIIGPATTRGCAIATIESCIAKPLHSDWYVQTTDESGNWGPEEFRFPAGRVPAFAGLDPLSRKPMKSRTNMSK